MNTQIIESKCKSIFINVKGKNNDDKVQTIINNNQWNFKKI